MKISEIFLSIDGEGKRTGQPVVFIRKFGCPLRCSYCDSKYTYEGNDYTEMTVDEILDKVESIGNGCKAITYTGGEPLHYSTESEHDEINELLYSLGTDGYDVNVETNGSEDIGAFYTVTKDKSIWFTMDWKSVSSRMSSKMLKSNLRLLNERDVLKFVVGSEEDLNQMKDIISYNPLQCSIYVSPVFGHIEPKDIVEYILENRLYEVKVQVQLHKILWDPDMRGV